MAEDTEYKKLSVEDRCTHKLWKARVDGFEEAAKIFHEIDDEKSTEWSKFLPLIRKMVADSNAVAQERGLEAVLVFVENCGHAGKTVGDVMSNIVSKCIAASRPKTKDLSVQITLKYVEIEKQEAVMEELIKGMEQKNPKVVSACVACTTLALHEFGSKVVNVKPLIKKLAPLMSDRDKSVRDEGKQLAVEIYRWIGPAMKQQISTLPQVTIKELEEEFDKLRGEKAVPNRYLKSEQEKIQKVAVTGSNDDICEEDMDAEAAGEEIDPMDLLDPVDILSKLPKDFYEKLEEKKWQLRKESLEALEKLLTDNQKLESGDYGGVVNALKKVITKDSNVVLVALATKCLAMLAKGLGKRFSPYAMACIPSLLEKFKEKKPNVVTALRDAIDAIYPATSLEQMQESIVESLNNKNPSVKAETASFLARAIARTQPAAINKKLLKVLVTSLIKTLNEADPTVRDNSTEALATLLKLLGDKLVAPFLVDVDALKMAKIKECQEKVELKVKMPSVKRERPATAPNKSTAVANRANVPEAKPTLSRPATSGIKKPNASGIKKPAAATGAVKSASSKMLATERELTPEEIECKAQEMLPTDIYAGLVDAAWKVRFSAAEQFLALVPSFDAKTTNLTQILVRTLAMRKPGLKETNFQVLKVKLDIIRELAENYTLTTTTIDQVINEVTDKLADAKNGSAAADVLTAFAEATKLDHVATKVLNFAFDQKSPKLQAEVLTWLNKSILEFGFQLQAKNILDNVRKASTSTNPMVRNLAVTLVGTMSMYLGKSILMYFDNEKPTLKLQIDSEVEKCLAEKPPKAVRGVKKSADDAGAASDDNGLDDEADVEPMNMADILPRIDISPQITEALLREMSDKDWKMRNEGLTKLQCIISEAKLIKSSIGDLGPALALRLMDSNAKITQTSLAICEQLATAMGPGCKAHVRTLFPGFLHALGDNKTFVRAAGLSCINTFCEQGGYKEFFEGEMIADALKSGSPALKSELWAWLAERLVQIPPRTISKEELSGMVPHLYAHIMDRNAEVRKNANEAVLGIMIHLGYDAMVRALDKQKPSLKKDLQAALDKARPNLPVKPLPKGKQQAPIEEKKTVRGGGGIVGSRSSATIASKAAAANKADAGEKATGGSSRKKEEDVDTSPLLAINNIKSQRLIDEQKMRVLKWTFTTPREEFTELLRDQMTTANVNKALMANMFHDDFRYHLKVIESLSEDLANNSKALVCNLDLILKWLSLRFYDTNPSVLIKGLEYLNQAFQTLVNMEYFLAENEGNSFIPHLLLKLGDPKDTVRNGVRTLIRQILLVYPFAKVFSHVMEGLKSKNARQRTECLDELGFLIENYGLSACQPSQQVALKEIARHISDRDNSVRNAALNCVVQAYFLAGEKVYKLIGQLNEKDLSMLDERIKRAKKTKKTAPEVETVPVVQVKNRLTMNMGPAGIVQQDSIEIEDAGVPISNACDELPPPDEQNSENSNTANSSTEDSTSAKPLKRQATFDKPAILHGKYEARMATQTSGPFCLDPDVIADIEKDWVRVDNIVQTEVPRVDISPLYESVKVAATRDGTKYPEEKFEQLISRSRHMQQALLTTPSPPSAVNNLNVNVNGSPYLSSQVSPSYGLTLQGISQSLTDVLPKNDPHLKRLIEGISSTDTLKARAAINELQDIVDSPEKQAVMRDYEEIFIQNVLAQLKHLSQLPVSESVVVYQPLLSITYSFFQSKILGRTLSVVCIKNLMSALLQLMADQKLNSAEDGQYNKVINGICLKVLDKTNFTNLNCALIRLLRETCQVAGLPKFTDLLMKCLWRNVKMLSERSNELNYDAVILEVHEFMFALPSVWWQNRPSDTPLRTVKTIIHNMAKIKGNAILQHLNQIPTHSELHAYLIKILKNLQRDGHLASNSPQRPITTTTTTNTYTKRLNNQTQDAFSQIITMISNKDTKQQGFEKLYKYKIDNPEVDVTAFLKGASPTFHQFIEDGLADIERSMMNANSDIANANVNCDNKNASSGTDSSGSYQTPPTTAALACSSDMNMEEGSSQIKDPEVWLDRLKFYRNRGNIGTQRVGNNLINTQMLDNKVVDENIPFNTMRPERSLLLQHEKQEITTTNQHLKEKLAQIKSQANLYN